MVLKSKWWMTSGSEITPPVGLIIGIKEGTSTPDNWTVWTDADGYYLVGTESDVTVTDTNTRSTITDTTGSGGSHTGGGTAPLVFEYGFYTYCTTNCHTPTKDPNSVGSHTAHTVGIDLQPEANKLKLVQASAGAEFFAGGIMFGLLPNTEHTAFATFNDYQNALLLAGDTTEHVAEVVTPDTYTGYVSGSHDHVNSNTYQGSGLSTGSYTVGNNSAGGSHRHTLATPAITPAYKRALVRAWELVSAREIEGLIGMWVGAGVPAGWEYATELNDYYLSCHETGSGVQSGDNTLDASGSTGSASHSHSFSGWDSDYSVVSNIPHSGSASHSHTWSLSGASYEPERYQIKFVKYSG